MGPVDFYGIAVGPSNRIWLGGWQSDRIWRYTPDRDSFDTLANGNWAGKEHPAPLSRSRGIAVDNRGWVWVATTNGYLWRVQEDIPDNVITPGATDTTFWKTETSSVIGAGVDFKGNIWTVSLADNVASRFDVDAAGDPMVGSLPMKEVEVGDNPYTYSDFTGFGLANFTDPTGFVNVLVTCDNNAKARWRSVTWNATTPPNTSVTMRIRTGSSVSNLSDWSDPFTASPADISSLMDAEVGIVQFILKSESLEPGESPILHDYQIVYECDQLG